MNVAPDYSAAYAILRTSADDGLEGHGFVFTIGRGTEVQAAAIMALAPLVVGLDVAETCADIGALARRLHRDSHLRWLGPEKGIVQMAIGALLNAVWDLAAKRAGKPLWRLLLDLSPEQICSQVNFHYLTDVLTEDEALDILRRNMAGREARTANLLANGVPAYTTSPGWLGYSDEHLARACRQAVADGWEGVKIKVGRDLDEDIRRCGLARDAIGPSRKLMIDANQTWNVEQAVTSVKRLSEFDLRWVEEPTHPDDVAAHARIAKRIAPVPIATGEHAPNVLIFKQFFEAHAIGIAQVDAVRSGGVNDVLGTLLLAAKFGIPVCPHAGGVGLCEVVQHLAIFDYIAIAGSLENRMIEFVDHLHEHFVDPVVVRRGRYILPTAPGFSSTIRPESREEFAFPYGPAWMVKAAT